MQTTNKRKAPKDRSNIPPISSKQQKKKGGKDDQTEEDNDPELVREPSNFRTKIMTVPVHKSSQ